MDNMNDIFNKLTNFKIKFTKKPTPVQVSNMSIIFVFGYQMFKIKDIELNDFMDIVLINLKEI